MDLVAWRLDSNHLGLFYHADTYPHLLQWQVTLTRNPAYMHFNPYAPYRYTATHTPNVALSQQEESTLRSTAVTIVDSTYPGIVDWPLAYGSY